MTSYFYVLYHIFIFCITYLINLIKCLHDIKIILEDYFNNVVLLHTNIQDIYPLNHLN